MKTLRYLQMATLVATLGLASCTNDDAPVINDGEFKIVASLADIQTRVNSEGDGGKFLPNDTIFVNATDNGYGKFSEAFVTDQGTVNGKAEFTPRNNGIILWELSEYRFFASNCKELSVGSHYNSSYEIERPIQVNQSTVDNLRRADIILAEPKLLSHDATNGVVPMKFVHVLSKVTVSVVACNGFDNINAKDMVIDNATMTSREISVWGTNDYGQPGYVPTVFSYKDGEFKMEEGYFASEYFSLKSISPYVTKDTSTGMYSFTAIIKPWTYSEGDVFMTFVIGGLEYKVLANTDLCTEGFLQPGKHYHFDLTINKKASASLSKVSLLDWDEEEFTRISY